MSTLFCRTLASQSPPSMPVHSRTPSESGSTRPLLQRANSLTFTTSSLRDSTPPPPSTTQQAFIPCSAAYQTLSRHANFDDSDLGQLVSGLRVDKADGRGVSVTSVRDALRSLDRGFDRSA
ncbi:hypothetical protein BCR37DRAFT_376706 [Protomyces lactucae-debilis]|uniref:Uncharacterized protein n=1 Tax=Protomyces lactucae-debilis TaxID=2754530 RepID=A0A1Y2FQA6_PROLT|nr:uncharacterized protein BCR37DRAFT_376706 [Protomyces lactucae-debilis]ORY86158.1 hypothetical protein BCR37DRAFT_376706 [Protomyces lactucae-debilis]